MSVSDLVSEEERKLVLLLVDLRKQLKVTQGQLGNVLGVSAQQLSKVERGGNRLGLGRFLNALKFLKEVAASQDTLAPSVSLGFAEAEQALYGVPADPRAELLAALRSMRTGLDDLEGAALKLFG